MASGCLFLEDHPTKNILFLVREKRDSGGGAKKWGKFTSARNVGTAFFRQLDPPLSLCSVTCFVLATERLIFSESFAVAIQNLSEEFCRL